MHIALNRFIGFLLIFATLGAVAWQALFNLLGD
jgi:hypothetical protein